MLRSPLFLMLVLLAAMLPDRARAATDDLLSAIVRVEALVPADSRTAESLGQERAGNGVVIGPNGLVLTIGYVVLEADRVSITTAKGGSPVPAQVIAYDHDTGLGLVRAASDLGVTPLELGDSTLLKARDRVLVAGFGGAASTQPAYVVSRRTFAGYWEYLLENAVFTSPPYESFAGAALIDSSGRLAGIGSLFIPDAFQAGPSGPVIPGNMFIPVEALVPILDRMIATGRANDTPKPWIGIQLDERSGHLFVRRVSPDSPAALAGLKPDDLVLGVGETATSSLADFYRALWASGDPGSIANIRVLDGLSAKSVEIRTGNRYQYLKLNRTY
ncbi:MAG: S1C family serine protease [Alphaproteobacteria bacterium]|nr:S1C family serine protease [Alphaproteobacteria bacterium]